MNKKMFLLVAALLAIAVNAQAKITLPAVIGDNMVLQQSAEVNIWGWTAAGKTVKVTASWDNVDKSCRADNEGRWSVKLTTPAASMKAYNIKFDDGERTEIGNVLVGEVWVCSGQSNMNMPVGGFNEQPVEGALRTIMDAPQQKQICMATLARKESATPLDDCSTSWQCTTPESVRSTSAVAYYFAEQLARTLPDVPIGLLITNWGGTQIQLWLPEERFYNVVPKEIADDRFLLRTKSPSLRGGLYNGMINPIVKYNARGFLWYQGESNVFQSDYYGALFTEMVTCWRTAWGDSENRMPFYAVQLAPYKGKSSERIERPLWIEAMLKTLKVLPNSYMVSTTDVGEEECIHPSLKREVGERLAAAALNRTYGFTDIPYETPELESCSFGEGKAIVRMKNVTPRGLIPWHGEVTGFEIAGENQMFYAAKAVVLPNTGGQIEVSSPMVKNPVAVRYAFHNYAVGNLKSIYGIPAYPFRTDNWDKVK